MQLTDMNMNSEKNDTSSNVPVMTLSGVFEALKAVGRGDQVAPKWAGKKVYIGFEAKEYWENIGFKGECL